LAWVCPGCHVRGAWPHAELDQIAIFCNQIMPSQLKKWRDPSG
jgi:hypothetical protein